MDYDLHKNTPGAQISADDFATFISNATGFMIDPLSVGVIIKGKSTFHLYYVASYSINMLSHSQGISCSELRQLQMMPGPQLLHYIHLLNSQMFRSFMQLRLYQLPTIMQDNSSLL